MSFFVGDLILQTNFVKRYGLMSLRNLDRLLDPERFSLFLTYLKHAQEKLCGDYSAMWRKAEVLEILQLWQTLLLFQLSRKAPKGLTKIRS